MASSSSLASVRAFVALVTEGDAPALHDLARALDSLAVAYHDAPPGQPAEFEAEPPTADYAALYETLSARFPDLGFYASTDPSEPDSEVLTGDAIDDLTDIVSELTELSWREAVLGADDAHWFLRFLFGAHWGRHMRDLSLYLHVKQFG